MVILQIQVRLDATTDLFFIDDSLPCTCELGEGEKCNQRCKALTR